MGNKHCRSWSARGMCEKEWVYENCRVSCYNCPIPQLAPTTQPPEVKCEGRMIPRHECWSPSYTRILLRRAGSAEDCKYICEQKTFGEEGCCEWTQPDYKCWLRPGGSPRPSGKPVWAQSCNVQT